MSCSLRALRLGQVWASLFVCKDLRSALPTDIALSRTSLFLLDDVKESAVEPCAPEPVGLENLLGGKLCYCTRRYNCINLRKEA